MVTLVGSLESTRKLLFVLTARRSSWNPFIPPCEVALMYGLRPRCDQEILGHSPCEDALPAKAVDDSLHIAIAAVHWIEYLLTRTCRHIDNAEMKPLIRSVCAVNGHACPEICTPQDLMGVTNDG